MLLPIRPASARVVADYLRAKDAQLPHLFTRVFTPEVVFRPTYAMPSPFGDDRPRVGFADVVGAFRALGGMCENIVTVVPVESLAEADGVLTSHWVVGMTLRDGPGGQVGWGTYHWTFSPDGTRAAALDVHFAGRAPLGPDTAPSALDALLALPHPWCTAAALVREAEAVPALSALVGWLRGASPPATAGGAAGTPRPSPSEPSSGRPSAGA